MKPKILTIKLDAIDAVNIRAILREKIATMPSTDSNRVKVADLISLFNKALK